MFANRLVETSKPSIDKKISRKVDKNLNIKKSEASENSNWVNKFTTKEVQIALARV